MAANQLVESDMNVLSLVLHFYTNISASGHQYLTKIMDETSVKAILEYILKCNLATKSEDLMQTCVRMVELISTLTDWEIDDESTTEEYQQERQ